MGSLKIWHVIITTIATLQIKPKQKKSKRIINLAVILKAVYMGTPRPEGPQYESGDPRLNNLFLGVYKQCAGQNK